MVWSAQACVYQDSQLEGEHKRLPSQAELEVAQQGTASRKENLLKRLDGLALSADLPEGKPQRASWIN